MTTKKTREIPSQKEKQEIDNKLLFILEESIPLEQNERKKYMADCAFFYSTIFREKLKHFIGMQLEELSQFGRSEREEDILRSNINAFRLIDTWMKEMTAEHAGNMTEIRNSFQNDEEFIKNIRETYI